MTDNKTKPVTNGKVNDTKDSGLLRFMTCGSVDDGKSTLIGRLLYDSKAILADTLNHIERSSKRRGGDTVDLSLLTDGLEAEREQGITIDVAYRYFSTGRRKYIIADAPGHEQYTRNMVTAASTADLAIILVDARRGVLAQTRRHACLAHLVGVRQLVVAVNKMDLAGYERETFAAIRDDFLAFAEKMGIAGGNDNEGIAGGFFPVLHFVPISALNGDNVVDRSGAMPWYDGPSLLDLLEAAPGAHDIPGWEGREHFSESFRESFHEPFRFPVQYVCRPQASGDAALHDYRGFMGRIESGSIRAGDPVAVLPSGLKSRVAAVHLGGEAIAAGLPEQSVTLLLEDDIDISRGDMIVRTDESGAPPEPRRELDAMLCWLSETPLSPARTYLIRHTTRTGKARLADVAYRVDVHSQAHLPAEFPAENALAMNDIARVRWKLAQPVFADAYRENRATGAFIVIDETTNNTVGAGMIC